MDNFQDWTPCQWSGHRYDDAGWCRDCGETSEDAREQDNEDSNMTVTEKIKAGDYESKLPYPKSALTKLSVEETLDARRAWRKDTDRLSMVVFKADLLEENDLTSHPKADKLFHLAWEHGHSSGLYEVEGYFTEFMELLK